MTESSDIRFLLTIRDSGSLTAASRKLGLSPSAVTQRLQLLEKKLSMRLVDRTARKLLFTEEGQLLCQRGGDLLQQFDALFEDLHERREGLVGTLKINAPLGFGRRYLAPVIADFQQQHPEVTLALTLSDRPLTETVDRFDIVVHIGELLASNLVGFAIAPNARFVCASPSFIQRYGNPTTPDELMHMPCIVLSENNEDVSLWNFSKGKTSRSVRVSSSLSCNDGDVIRRWGCEGRGVILRSEWDVADDIQSGRLVRLLPTWKAPDANVIALTHNRAGLPARTRHFMTYLQSRFKPTPPWRT
ncbi:MULTISPECIES: LysR substrate-binding domain-containing protein [unclassified Brenneria]|uniref:LysR substrate-binding domain-containing protein n=1 Tax=unclassified Brenneria TaxID=2634434 RepID=UPI0015553F01|nr:MULTISPECIES: LysR substrate-binding domain-containing protein [unclassified Brenneria]MBJ7220368.1 LysR family transcriptional regulator [Brenneria sp. L3-3C-1]MEE3641613.1 LysR substrate-binding domain-containing protein [Brenneria sp. L3_3C_1]MEE3649756.1 LysR substrate-binding domain-containing protein [Brenneria sp. HEZEL_4_2_4]NPC99715.1 LysR family transcriptional regulator [Brenneria sp. hezel4-2-4]